MEPLITDDEKKLIENFVSSIKKGKINRDYLYRNPSHDDLQPVFSALRKLLDFGARVVQNPQYDYALYYANSANNPILLLGLTLENTQMIQELLSAYRTAESNAARDRFLSMKVTDMTGADLAQFLKLISQ